MSDTPIKQGGQSVIERDQLNQLLHLLTEAGYRMVGPTLREGAVVYDDIASVDDLPRGWTDELMLGVFAIMPLVTARRRLRVKATMPHEYERNSFHHAAIPQCIRAL